MGLSILGKPMYSVEQGTFTNDYNFPEGETGIGNRHFYIRYSFEEKKYYLKDLSDGSGTFIKIQCPLQLATGYIISFGDNHMTMSIDDKKQLTVKFLEGIRTNEKYTYAPSQMPITMGRLVNNTIVVNSISISKRHCKYCIDQNIL